jgi:AcrR family transcriptional regulator
MANSNILDAALVLFAKQGFDGTTIKEISANAGLKPSSIYSHYQSKEEIFLEILNYCIDHALKSIRPLQTKVNKKLEIDPEKILFGYYQAIINHFLANKEEYLFLKQACFFNKNQMTTDIHLLNLFGEDYVSYFEKFFDELQKQQIISSYDSKGIVFAYIGVILAYLEESIVYQLGLRPTYLEKSWEIFWKGIKKNEN